MHTEAPFPGCNEMSDMQANRLDEPIAVEEYNPAWTSVFRAEALKLHSRLGNSALGVEHIGSTAVPGLRAKPVVDIMVGVGPNK